MISAGIDLGAKRTKAVIIKDGELWGKGLIITGFDLNDSAEKVFKAALEDAGISGNDVEVVVTTGMGKKGVKLAAKNVSEASAAAKGAHYLDASIRTVIEVGAEEARAVRCDENGKVLDFTSNEKCAAGTGSFVESMARALDTDVEKIAEVSLESTRSVPMNAQCVVFAESEVVSLIHQQIPEADIARAVHDAISGRISSMTRTVGIKEKVGVIGGVAVNRGFIQALEEDLDLKVLVPENAQFASAIGAALLAD